MTTDLSQYDETIMPSADELSRQRYAIIVADWNKDITFAMAQGAIDTLLKHGVKKENISINHVPGAVELTYAARLAMTEVWFTAPITSCFDQRLPVAIIVIGCVIKGDTPHFDYVCQSVTQGVTKLNAEGTIPVIFSVLTTLNKQQALDRAGGKLGNKGVEGAVTAIRMANL